MRDKFVRKKLCFTFLVACSFFLLLLPSSSSAQSIDLTGGIKNEYEYEEYFFLTGKPIKFTGTNKNITISARESKGKLTETYKFTLAGPSGEKLTRNFTYTYDVTNYDQVGQSSATGEVTKFTEKITVGDRTFTLADYHFLKVRLQTSVRHPTIIQEMRLHVKHIPKRQDVAKMPLQKQLRYM